MLSKSFKFKPPRAVVSAVVIALDVGAAAALLGGMVGASMVLVIAMLTVLLAATLARW